MKPKEQIRAMIWLSLQFPMRVDEGKLISRHLSYELTGKIWGKLMNILYDGGESRVRKGIKEG